MSFILDALKKSESDRQQQNSPDIMQVPTGSDKSSSSRWLMIIGALLLINVAVLSFVILRPAAPNNSTTPVATAIELAPPENVTDNETTDDAESFRDLVANARREQPVSSAPATVETRSEPPPNATPAVEAPAPEQTSTQAGSVAATTMTAPPSAASGVHKTFNQVRVEGRVQLPDLHLDVHVYNANPADRFVFINMEKYKERATLGEGPTVSEIVPEGVILEFSGTRFLLPRQ